MGAKVMYDRHMWGARLHMAVTLGSIAAALLGFAGVAQRGQGPSHEARCCTGIPLSLLCDSGTSLCSEELCILYCQIWVLASTCTWLDHHALPTAGGMQPTVICQWVACDLALACACTFAALLGHRNSLAVVAWVAERMWAVVTQHGVGDGDGQA